MEKIFARLVPYNPRQGYLVQGYNYRSFGFVGGERPHWYEVDPALAAELRVLKQEHTDPRSQPLFQLCNEEEKLAIEQHEQSSYLARLGAVAQTVSLSKELVQPPTVKLAAEAPPPVAAVATPVPAAIATQAVPSPAPLVNAPVAATPVSAPVPVDDGRAAATPMPRAANRRTARSSEPMPPPPIASVGALTTDDINPPQSDE